MVGIGAKALIFSCLAEVLSPSVQVMEGRQSQIPPGSAHSRSLDANPSQLRLKCQVPSLHLLGYFIFLFF